MKEKIRDSGKKESIQNFLGFKTSRKWNANWIWHKDDGTKANIYYYFRKTFNIKDIKERYAIYISAETRYILYVNGTLAGEGPPISQPYFKYYDERDISGLFKKGENIISVIVNFNGASDNNRAGLLIEIEDIDGNIILSTDDSWRTVKAEPWETNTLMYDVNRYTRYQEIYDARKAPDGWMDKGFNDSNWEKARILKSHAPKQRDEDLIFLPWMKLVPRDIQFMATERLLPQKVVSVEEALDLENRIRKPNLCPFPSQPGRPLKFSSLTGEKELLTEEGVTVARCSVNHLDDLDFDGIYSPSVLLDFGKIITAYAEITLKGPAGSIVEIGYAERLVDDYFTLEIEGPFADRYILKDGVQKFRSFTWKSFRFLKLRFRGCYENPIEVQAVAGINTTFPYEEKGKFESTDETLNKVWDISKATVRLCSNDFFMDTPWREQAQWLGDTSLVTIPAVYACFGNVDAPGKFLRQSANTQSANGNFANMTNIFKHDFWLFDIVDYSLWYVQALWDHYMYTGEDKWINNFYPHILRFMYSQLDYLGQDGLIDDMKYWIFIDWADVETRGECAAYNAIFYGVMKTVLKMAEFKCDSFTIEKFKEIIKLIENNFRERLFDEKLGVFSDANIDGHLSPKISEQANMAAIYFGLIEGKERDNIINAFYEDKTIKYTEAQPFFMQIVLRALHKVGRMDIALDLIKKRWGKRMVDKGATTTYEEWYQNGTRRDGEFLGCMRTNSHAWSACPASFLIFELAGFKILEPGSKKVSLDPLVTEFDYSITIPTILGNIDVSCISGKIIIKKPEKIEVKPTR